jgi:hypothetical protein
LTSISLAVIVGLVAGIALIAVVAIALKPSENMIDDDLRMMMATEYPQFKALEDRYPNILEQFERIDSKMYVRYVATREPFRESSDFSPKMLILTLTVDPISGRSLDLTCGSSLSIDLPPKVRTIETTDCLETPYPRSSLTSE